MTKEEAEVYAQKLSFEDAIYNLSQARCIPYRKATFIKIKELLNTLENKRGYWIEHSGYWECSKCHSERAYGNEYCPDCGSHNGDIGFKPLSDKES